MPETSAEYVILQLEKCYNILRVELDVPLRGLGLTLPQYRAMAALAAEPGLSAAALARRCAVAAQTMTGVVANLLKAGLVAREPDPDHGRAFKVRLTSRGAERLRLARRAVAPVEQRMVAELDPAERDALADLLADCAGSLAARAK